MLQIPPIGQRDPRWAGVILGTSSVTIGGYGCTITSLTMLLNYFGYNETPITVNNKLKANNGYANKNLIIWTAIPKIWDRINFEWRGYGYDNNKVSDNLPCLVEVDFDGSERTNDRHWVLFKGGKRMNDPWTGLDEPTSKYNILTGYAIITGEHPENNQNNNKENNMSKILEYMGLKNDSDAISKLKEHLGEKDNKCNWGETGDSGGFLGSARKKINSMSEDHQKELSVLQNNLKEIEKEIKSVKDENQKLTKKQADLAEALVSAEGQLDMIKRVGYKSFDIPTSAWSKEETILGYLNALSSGGNPESLGISKLFGLIFIKLKKLAIIIDKS